MSIESITTAYAAFVAAHERVRQAEIAACTMYCLCGNEFPEGRYAGRIPPMNCGVLYADNRCAECGAKD
jgi:hypothetical protein